MRLLSTANPSELVLKSFINGSIEQLPLYAILSHCWGDDEVLFTDISEQRDVRTKKGYAKLSRAIATAKAHGYAWIWCDTCCIDKSSSAELSETINSMWALYKAADICYAFIEDVSAQSPQAPQGSRWFTRGWTLQELIAPHEVVFFDRDWVRLGCKSDLRMSREISRHSGIDLEILLDSDRLSSFSVAKRMSWAARREVTRPEDIAYCLLGIFQINMPMLYGEGRQNSFHRLQEHIMKESSDHSIFAWAMKDADPTKQHGLLADGPEAFTDSSSYLPYADWEDSPPLQLSNKGIRIDLHLEICNETSGLAKWVDDGGLFYALLNCPSSHLSHGYSGFIAIYLQKRAHGLQQYARVRCHELKHLDFHRRFGAASTVFVRQKQLGDDQTAMLPGHFLVPRSFEATPADGYELLKIKAYGSVNAVRLQTPHLDVDLKPFFRPTGAYRTTIEVVRRANSLSAIVCIRNKASKTKFTILLGSLQTYEPGFDVVTGDETDITKLTADMNLQPFGRTMNISNQYNVRVDATIKIEASRKLYLLDFSIDQIGDPVDPKYYDLPGAESAVVTTDKVSKPVVGALAETRVHKYGLGALFRRRVKHP